MVKPILDGEILPLGATLTAIEQIESLITEGNLRRGDRLPPERDLAASLGCSRPTVREALRALSLLGVIERRQGSGNYVRDLDDHTMTASMRRWMAIALPAEDVACVLEIRAVLESGLARLAATKITDEAIGRLRSLLSDLQAAETPDEVLRLDMAMHDLMAEQSGNRVLSAMLASIREVNAAARFKTIAAPGVQQDVARDQAVIVAALETRDSKRAADAMWQHLMRILAAYQSE